MNGMTYTRSLDGYEDVGLRDGVTVGDAICRLADYERSGLEPESILDELKALKEQAQREHKSSIAEVIAGLRDLARDRESFFTPDGGDEMFRRDYAVCMEAVGLLEKERDNAGET